MNVSFDRIAVGNAYDRQELADLWGCAGTEALQRGVVTPRGDNKIILFVTENKHPDATQYRDRLVGNTLEWEGPNDHFAEDRMIGAPNSQDEIHVFYRTNPNEKFTYLGLLEIVNVDRQTDAPSRFTFRKRSR
jgi:putative restriction endonuclease